MTNYELLRWLADFVQLVEEEDERLFRRINNNSTHVRRGLLPPPSMATQQYSLRRRPHDRQMPDHTGHLADKNFLIRMLYKDSYWLFLYCNSVLSVSICVVSYINKEMIDWLIDWPKRRHVTFVIIECWMVDGSTFKNVDGSTFLNVELSRDVNTHQLG